MGTVASPDLITRRLRFFVAPVTTHARDIDGEVRLQPPGPNRPITMAGDDRAVLVGLTPKLDVAVVAPADRHVNRIERWTVTFREGLVDDARRLGWTQATRPLQPHGIETLYAMRTPLLPVYLEAQRLGVSPDPSLIQAAVMGAGLPEDPDDPVVQDRARAASYRWVRDSVFGAKVRAAYANRCAMCGLGFDLVEGAHVYPVAAPGSPDLVSNGICLCKNHHRAFDLHMLWIDPRSLRIVLHPDFMTSARGGDVAARGFVDSTASHLRLPMTEDGHLDPAMLEQRYSFFGSAYDWTTS